MSYARSPPTGLLDDHRDQGFRFYHDGLHV